MSKEQTELAEAVAKIYAAIEAAKEIADKQNTTFNLYPAYGMGGTYHSPGHLKADLERCTKTAMLNGLTFTNTTTT
ncbi:hypothetical protein MAR005P1_00006 [Escherichia virus vB_Eco_mar005P1]|nr:hypothetical protein MAR007P3_00056 [Escherichia virus vB_Eco_mar005P1]VCU43912.1 hypothetical protein MAR008P4_00021 [Escherichia virus vB_Eco_mar005P1]VCU44344.1 hypothetical protein MAR005P1_00006 [Escherichia virus vB_Eco_mar005P1]VCU44353.1 hypothetical protein MAR006P2_00185 [Escherichia virus vB_Eco_mar005P1]VCU44869.1 hypothetical protein MAR009P5_00178 [Escherichia virus vB_Eco_mar005P1]